MSVVRLHVRVCASVRARVCVCVCVCVCCVFVCALSRQCTVKQPNIYVCVCVSCPVHVLWLGVATEKETHALCVRSLSSSLSFLSRFSLLSRFSRFSLASLSLLCLSLSHTLSTSVPSSSLFSLSLFHR